MSTDWRICIMYRRCLIALLCSVSAFAAAPTLTPTPTPSTTPVVAADSKRLVDQISAEEKAKAAELWSTAMDKFAGRNFRESAKLLEDYVNRYPGTPESIDARYHLAQSYLFSKNPGSAIPSFLAVIEIRGRSELGNEARTYLGQSYLDASKFTEAYLVSEELLDQTELGENFRAKALLIRAHAQAGLGQNLEAEKTLVAFQAIAESDPELERETANSFLVSLLLKSNHCDALPSAKALPEDQVLDQMARKGICVLEMGTLLARAAKRLSGDEIMQAADTLASSLTLYRRACASPPLTAGKLGKAKFANAKKELTAKLKEGCANAEKLLLETFRDRENLKSVITKLQPKESRT
jgi:hypothetical protein